MEEKKKAREYAVATLINIWNCIDWSKVDSKRAYNIWDEFANKVKAASYTTNKYERFVEKLCKKLNINSLKFREIKDIETQKIDIKEQIMDLLREETLSLVLEVKLNKEVIKEQKKLERDREEKQDEN